MWKQLLKFSIAILIVTGWLPAVAGSSVSSCGVDLPLPPGGLNWPVSGQMTQPWSLDCGSDKGHRGIDIAAPAGSSIKAAAGGTITFVGYTPAEGGGTTISISHPGGLRSTYLHLDQAAVSTGQSVAQGQPIGTSAGPAVHLGLKVEGAREQYFDPLPYLKPAPPDPEPVRPSPQPVQTPAAEPVVPPATPAPAAATATQPTEPKPSLAPGLSQLPVPAGHQSPAGSILSLNPGQTVLSPAGAPSANPMVATPSCQTASPSGKNRPPAAAGTVAQPDSAEKQPDMANHAWPLRLIAIACATALIIIVGFSSGTAGKTARRSVENGFRMSPAVLGS